MGIQPHLFFQGKSLAVLSDSGAFGRENGLRLLLRGESGVTPARKTVPLRNGAQNFLAYFPRWLVLREFGEGNPRLDE